MLSAFLLIFGLCMAIFVFKRDKYFFLTKLLSAGVENARIFCSYQIWRTVSEKVHREKLEPPKNVFLVARDSFWKTDFSNYLFGTFLHKFSFRPEILIF